ncbi:phage major capsid protein [uncultured Pseudomonas sp.]|uniref:phage major capsid protein n=1 Tax=uncultured Pseudomonas sp. TaxID=114707 RepID=UPI0025D9E950|nr:phage major capsid protein [uncultured Pseudomonas sp.]
MSLELLTKAVTDHGAAVAAIGGKIDEAQEGIKQLSNRMFVLEQGAASGADWLDSGSQSGLGSRPETAIKTFTKSAQLKSMQEGAQSTGRVELAQVSIKALVNDGRGQAGDSGVIVPPQRAAGIYNDPRPVLSLLSMLPSIPVTSGSYEYTQLKAITGGADYQVKEGDLKAETDFELVPATANISTIAHWTRASVQILDDAPSLEVYVSNLLTYGAMQKLERELLVGTSATGKIEGLVAQSTPFVPATTDSPTDRLGSAVANMKAAGWNPNVIVINALDWFDITKTKADGSGTYLMGSPQNPAPQTLWNCTVVPTPGIPRGTALVLDSAQVAVLDRMAPAVIASRFDRDNMVTNMITLLAELRAGLAVFSEAAVYSVAITAA